MRWPDLTAHRPWKGGSWQYFSPIFHSPSFHSEVVNAHTFYLTQTLVFSGFLCELMQHVNLPEKKSTRKKTTVFSARLMNWTDSQNCLMSAREKARECAGRCGTQKEKYFVSPQKTKVNNTHVTIAMLLQRADTFLTLSSVCFQDSVCIGYIFLKLVVKRTNKQTNKQTKSLLPN